MITMTGAVLHAYIRKHFPEERIHVVLDHNLSASQKVIYSQQLQETAELEERRREEGNIQFMFKLKSENMDVKIPADDTILQRKYTKQIQECTVGNIIARRPLRL